MHWYKSQVQWVILPVLLAVVTCCVTAQNNCSTESVGLQNGDHQLIASSSSDDSRPDNARYDAIQSVESLQLSCWQPAADDLLAWIQVDFDQLYDIWSIQFQECGSDESGTSNVVVNGVEYSLYSNGDNFITFLEATGSIFGPVNIDSLQFLEDGLATPVEFWKPIVSHRLRLNIGVGSRFRFEVLGCVLNSTDWYCDDGKIDSIFSESLVCPYPVTVDLGDLASSSYVADSESQGNEAWRASFSESGGWRPASLNSATQCLRISFPYRMRVEGIIGKFEGQEDLSDEFYIQNSYDGSFWSSDMINIFDSDISGCTRRTYFDFPKIALQVRVCWISTSSTFYGSLSVEILGCLNNDCLVPLRINQQKMNLNSIVDTSSNQDDQHIGTNSAIDILGRLGLGWTPSSSDENQWFEVTMANYHIIYSIVIQGCSSEEKWVMSYKLGYKRPLEIYMEFTYDDDNDVPRQTEQIFEGSIDNNSFSKNVLPYSIITDVLRIIPVTWQNDICLRLDVIGGEPNDCIIPIEPISIDQVSSSRNNGDYSYEDVFTTCWLGTDIDEQPYQHWLQVDLFHDYLITAINFSWIERNGPRVVFSDTAYRINYVSSIQESWKLYINDNGNQNITDYGYMELAQPFTANKLRISLAGGCLRINEIYGFSVNGVKPLIYCDSSLEMQEQLSRFYNDCPFPIGLESGKVDVHQISASSSIDVLHSTNSGRLNHLYGWQAGVNDRDQWFQIEFDQRMIITGLQVQASDSCNLEKFILKYGYPPEENNNVTFYDYLNPSKDIEEFMMAYEKNCTQRILLDPYIHANYLQVIPIKWINCIGLRIEVLGCKDKEGCPSTAGLSSGDLADNSLTASSATDADHVPSAARLSSLSYSVTCWSPASTDNISWITAELPPSRVHGMVMQGCEGNLWVEKFTLSYTSTGLDSYDVLDSNGFIKEFSANINSYDLAYIEFETSLDDIVALTIHPIKWSGGIGMNFELIACLYEPCSNRLGLESGAIAEEQIETYMPGVVYEGSLRLYGAFSAFRSADSSSGYGYYKVSLLDVYSIRGTITLTTDPYLSEPLMFWIEYKYENETFVYQTIDGTTQMFLGGDIHLVEITNLLERPIITNEVLFYTSTGVDLSFLQFEILGCSLTEMGPLCAGDDRVQYDGFCFGTVESSASIACHDIFYPEAEPAIIRSENEMEFIRKTNNFQREAYSQFIIGAMSDMNGGLVWRDSTPVLYDNFREQPDTINDNECVAVDGLEEQNWVLFNCDDNLSTPRATLCQADLNECIQSDICSYDCVNTPGSYYCTCQPGYYIGDDGSTCEDGCRILTDAMEVEWSPLIGQWSSDNSKCLTVLSNVTDEIEASNTCQQLNAELANTSVSSIVVGFNVSCEPAELTSTIPLVSTTAEPASICDSYLCIKDVSILMCYDMDPNSSVTLTDAYGFIGCLHWPPFFNTNTNWMFDISVASSKSIRMFFREISVRTPQEDTEGAAGCVDILITHDISSDHGSTLLAEICHSFEDLTLLSRSNQISLSLQIEDLTSDVPLSIGFEMFYTELDCQKEECDYGCGIESVYTAPNGQISTINFPEQVRDYANCEFAIQIERNKYIEIVFHNVDIASHGDGSCKDTLEVIDAASGRQTLTGKICGTSMPTVTSTTYAAVIILKTGPGGESSGFEASYTTVDFPGCAFGSLECKKNDCNTTSGVIASVNYPHAYEPSCKMEWSISVSIGSYIHFEILDIDLRSSDQSCREDFLKFSISESNMNIDDEVMPKICQPLIDDEQINSPSNFLRVTFESNSMDQGTGFLARYRETKFEPNLVDKNITGSCPSGWNKYNDQCYSFQTADKLIDWNTAQSNCIASGGQLTSISTYDEMQYVHSILTNEPDAIGQYVYIGLMREIFGRQLFRWIDGRPASYMDWYLSSTYATNEYEYRQPESSSIESCTVIEMFSVVKTDQWLGVACAYEISKHFICERPLPGYVNMESVILNVPSVIDVSPCQSAHHFQCSSGDCIAAAFVCDGMIDCFDASDEAECEFLFCPDGYIEVFETGCISLSLICDGRMDLRSGIDETGCVYPSCSDNEFQCGTGKCINETLVCNGVNDCSVGDDELDCVNCAAGFFQCHDSSCLPSHAVCDGTKDCGGRNYEDEPETCNYQDATNKTDYCLESEEVCNNGACVGKSSLCLYDIDQYGIQLGCRDATHLRSCEDFECPAYTFKCPDSYCIPMRRRCDHTWDCPNGEDEKDCDSYSCSNYYHCRSSLQCLSPLDVCDGVKNCPLGDDEQFCDISCPSGCLCSGFIVQCSSTLSSADLELLPTSVRFLDLSGSLPTDSTEGRKKRSIIGDFLLILDRFPFLHTLDLSDNNIESLDPGGFASLINLRKLNLSGNSIVLLEDKTFEGLTKLTTLDVSNNGLVKIDKDVFVDINNTRELYIDGNSITDIDLDIFKYLELGTLVSDEYKFCCLATATSCTPTPDEFSSCNDLMRAEVLRVFIWILGISAFVGNFCVVIWRLRIKEKNKVQGYLIQNLAVSDFFMGVYLLVIASADIYYRDNYVIYANEWKNSKICSFAGFLSVFSSEMSVYILTVITIDRFICIVFPFSRFRMRAKGTLRVLVIGWVLVFLVSIIPAFSIDYFANFYGVNAVCLALPITHQDLPAAAYSITFFLGVNLLSFIVIAVCYITMYIRVKRSADKLKENIIRNDSKRKELKMAIKMAIIVLTDMCCWLPIILMGILARSGAVEIPGGVYAWTAVFLLPLNSAINPYLYTFSSYITLEKKKKTTSNVTSSTPLSTPQPMKKLNNIPMWVMPENVHRKRQLLPYLRESSSQAITIATRLKDSEGGGVKDEELAAIEKQYLEAVNIIRKCQQGQSQLFKDAKPADKDLKPTDEDDISKPVEDGINKGDEDDIYT